MDKMKYFPLGLVFAVLFSGGPLAAQEVAYARYSPLPVYTLHSGDDESRRKVSIGFGEALPIIDLSNDTVLVSLPKGGTARFGLADVVLSNADEYVLPGANFGLEDRARLSFWDSKLRAQGFLQHGPSDDTSPFLKESSVTTSIPALPLLDLSYLNNSLGGKVRVSHSLVPVSDTFLEEIVQTEQQASDEIDLHIIVDASNYARDFAQRRLHAFSRRIATSHGLKDITLTRSVILENGNIVGPQEIQLSGLRQLLPQDSGPSDSNADIAKGLTRALQDLTVKFRDDDHSNRTSILLILVGPGVREDVLDSPEFVAAASALRQQMRTERAGIMIGAVTPEPSEMPRLLLSRLGIGMPGTVIDFADRLDSAISTFSDQILASGPAREADEQLCYYHQEEQTFCLSAESMGAVGRILSVSDQVAFEWFAVPMWHIIDGTTLVQNRKLIAKSSEIPHHRPPSPQDIIINALRDDIVVLQEEIESVTEVYSLRSQEMAAEVAQLTDIHATLEAELNIASEQEQELRAALSLARDDTEFLETRLKALGNQYADERDNRILLQQELQKVHEALRTNNTEKQLLERTLSELVREKSRSEQQVDYLLEKNAETNSELSALSAANTALQGKATELTKELEINLREKITLNTIIDEKNTRIQEFAQEMASVDELLRNKNAQIVALESERSILRAEYSSAVEKESTAVEEINDLQTQVLELERIIDSLQSQKSKSLANEQSLMEQLSQAKFQLTEFEKSDYEKNATILDLQQKNIKLQTLNEDLSSKQLMSEQELGAQKKSYSELEMQLDELQSRFNDVNEERLQLQSAMQDSNLRLSNLNAERDEIFSLLRSRTENFLETQNEFQNEENSVALDTSTDDLPSVIKYYQDAMINAQEQIQILNNVQNALKDELEATESRLAHQSADYAVEKAKFSSEIMQYRQEATQWKERLIAQKEELAGLQREKESLSERLEQRTVQISQLNNLLEPIGERLAIDISQADFPETINKYNEIILDTLDQNDKLLNEKEVLEVEVAELRQTSPYGQLGEDEIVVRLQEIIEAKDDIISQREFEINKLQSENEEMRARIEIAMGVAEENIQLISAINSAEQTWLNREASFRDEIALLKQKLNNFEAIDAQVNDGTLDVKLVQPTEQIARLEETVSRLNASLRPMARPEDLSAGSPISSTSVQPSRTQSKRNPAKRVATAPTSNKTTEPSALPGSLFVGASSAGTASGAFQTNGGFFGN